MQILEPPAPPPSQLSAPEPRQLRRAREEAARAEGSGARGRPAGGPLLVAAAQAPRAALEIPTLRRRGEAAPRDQRATPGSPAAPAGGGGGTCAEGVAAAP